MSPTGKDGTEMPVFLETCTSRRGDVSVRNLCISDSCKVGTMLVRQVYGGR